MKKRSLTALLCAAASASMILAACGDDSSASTGASTDDGSAKAETVEVETTTDAASGVGDAGFTEIPIWEDEEVGFLNVSGVYFQPVPMSGGNESFEDYDLHFEADVSTLENNLGYGAGAWVPYMTVKYKLTGKNSGEVIEGSFMPMNADDGNHYGANLKMPTADTYSVHLEFGNPEENGFLVHLDDETGPGGSFADYSWPLVLDLEDVWDYTPQEW